MAPPFTGHLRSSGHEYPSLSDRTPPLRQPRWRTQSRYAHRLPRIYEYAKGVLHKLVFRKDSPPRCYFTAVTDWSL